MRRGPDRAAQVPAEVTGQPRRVVVGAVHWRQTFAALRHRNFRLFIAGQLLSLIGTWAQSTAQGWLVYQLTGSKLWLGLVAAAGSAPMLLFSLLGGSVADRHPKRSVLLCTQVALMASALCLWALAWTGHVQPWHVAVLAAWNGVAMAFDMPARQSFIVEMTSRTDLMNAIALNSSIFNGARVLGPAVAGYLMASVGIASCFLLNGLSFIAVITGLLMMRLPASGRRPRTGSTWDHAMEGLSYAFAHRQVRSLLMLLGTIGIFGWSYSVLMPALARDVFAVGEKGYSHLLSANGLGALCGALTLATFGSRFAPRRMMLAGLSTFSASLLLAAVTTSYHVALVCLIFAGWGMILYFSTTNSLVQSLVSDSMRGRVMGIWALIFGGMLPVGGMQAGAVSHWFGVRWALAFAAIVCAAAAFAWSRSVRSK